MAMDDNEKKDLREATMTDAEELRTEEIRKLQGGKQERRRKRRLSGSISSVIKTFGYLTFVILMGVLLAVVVIFAANDVFAFRKPTDRIEVTIGEYTDIGTLAETLAREDVIHYPDLFHFYAVLKHKSNRRFTAGTYEVSPSMGYDALLSAFVPHAGKREQISITVREGCNVDEIIDIMLSNGIGSKEGFVKAINETSYDYWFLEDVPEMSPGDGRFYRLEGYLYPDTYYFYTDSSETEVIEKMLANFGTKFKKKYESRCEKLGYTMEEIITLASLVQAEAKYESDYTAVSSVFHNRLKSELLNHTLQSDATMQYYFRHFEGSKHMKVTVEDLQIESPYNSYLHAGLPVGPITSPTISAISAAMYPVETEYYYFVTNGSGKCLFAKTYAGHLVNIDKVEKEEQIIGDEDGDE